MDQYATFAEKLPSWCGPDGKPLSYRHFRYGLARIGRSEIQESLYLAQANRMSRANEDDYSKWRSDMKMVSD